MAEKRDENGNLEYGESHMNCNLFNINAIDEGLKYLEEIDNPHHDLDGEKCSDYTYPMVKISFDTMINEIYLIENILGKECKYGTRTSSQNADS